MIPTMVSFSGSFASAGAIRDAMALRRNTSRKVLRVWGTVVQRMQRRQWYSGLCLNERLVVSGS